MAIQQACRPNSFERRAGLEKGKLEVDPPEIRGRPLMVVRRATYSHLLHRGSGEGMGALEFWCNTGDPAW
ncbi:hypothetical protein AKJ51_04920 [candidate division MSBL1 archaeon SCGC-AAA382A20]|uniref:Uncharacterized protein n=1 Tax=candidate division MSBL1 archaeon SCGC-AAA382A20 TaxID=1698280 RepID=A0A133VGR1_9EURY|nr:hypothetical protein AKJ51_04920 [candidate division MSBL1 archaeon SCGC-AAA382A20]